MALFPHADRVPPNGLRLGDVEVWAAPLILRSGDRVHTLCFDHALSTRRLAHPTFGWVLSAEDQLTLKLTLRRDEPGKCDLDDAVALLRHWEGRLDRDYLAWRAEQTGVSDLVREVFS